MASTSPSPKPPVTAVPPASSFPSNSSTITPPPTLSESNQTSDTPAPLSPSTPSNSSAPPPQSPPQPAVPPPSTPAVTPPPTLSPPRTITPSPPAQPPSSPPPTPVNLPPPPLPAVLPPPKNSSAPPNLSPPPPIRGSPPKASPAPPPPVEDPSPPSSDTPPAPTAKPPSNLHPPPIPPPSGSPPRPTAPLLSSPPPVPSSEPPHVSSPAPPKDSSSIGSTPPSPLPTAPKERPTARSGTHDPTSTVSDAPRDAGGLKIGVVVSIGVAVGLLALSLLVLAVWLTRRQKKEGSDRNGEYMLPSPSASSQTSDSSFLRPQQSIYPMRCASNSKFTYSSETGGAGYSKSWFTYQELAEATYGFSATTLLGEGGFGCVYKGLLADGREVAIKQLKIGGGQGEREFKAEVEIISRVHHRHLVSLVGYCIADHQRLLVYDYVPNDTLHYHLHAEGRAVMDWETRVKVAAGAARGLAYLHEDCHPRIIHRDIKSSNILLDYNFDAQVADFGLAKLALDANTHVTTRVMGTFGYMAPEYASSGKLTEKSDVFSFGVVLLELITGRKPVDSSQPSGDESLVEWARPLLTQALDKQDFEKLADPRLGNNFPEHEMFRMIEAAAACVRHLAAKRPRMSQVVRALDSMFEFSDLTNGMKPGQSEIFDTREQSAQIRMFRMMAFGSQDYSSEFFDHSQSSLSK